jgi:tRNA(fMet)-specific endonuclease VapC
MSRYLLDTETITLVQFGHAMVIRNLTAHADTDRVLSVVSFQEQMRGWVGRFGKLTATAQQADWYDRLVTRIFPVWRQFEMLAFPQPAIVRFEHLRSQRLNIGLMDLRLGAVALENSLIVVTRNARDFARIPGLRTEDWSV